MKKYLLLLMVCALAACEKPYIADDGDEEEHPVLPGDGEHAGEVL